MRDRNAASLCAIVIACLLAGPAAAQKGVPPTTVTIGGRALVSDHDLVDNLAQSPDHTVLAELLRTAGMLDGLRAHGPFTLFAPTNAAFAALPPGELDALRRPDNKAKLVALLSEAVIVGNYSDARLHYLLRLGKGSTDLDTVSEGKVTVVMNGPRNLQVKSSTGVAADVILYDVKAANGVMFVTDRVLPPD